MGTKKIQMTVREALAFYGATKEMPGSGLKLGALRSIDLAINKKAVEPIVVGYENAIAEPEGLKKVNDAITRANRLHKDNPSELQCEIDRIMAENKEVIAEVERINKERRAGMDVTKEIELIMIPRGEFKADDSDKAAEVFFGLLPCIE